MDQSDSLSEQQSSQTGKLMTAVRQAQEIAAAQADSSYELREAGRARLELLAAELTPVFDEVPVKNSIFDFALSSGETPRLWIDAVAHVGLARDFRNYRFVRDTRAGRILLAESADSSLIAEKVTQYIAERLVERKRFIEGDTMPILPASEKIPSRQETPFSSLGSVLWLLFGALVGTLLVLVIMQERFPEVERFLEGVK